MRLSVGSCGQSTERGKASAVGALLSGNCLVTDVLWENDLIEISKV